MNKLDRRDFMRLAGVTGATMAGLGVGQNALAGSIKLQKGGLDFSPKTGKKRE
ncbi:MAG: hypothetical protein DRR06_16045, partial [Gammaproteobacteria bacterium]